MTAVGEGSNLEEGDAVEQEALPSVMGQPESHDPTFENDELEVLRPQGSTSGQSPQCPGCKRPSELCEDQNSQSACHHSGRSDLAHL